MANQYIVAKRNTNENNGLIGISIKVFEAIAAYAVEDIKGVRVMPNTKIKKAVTCEVVNDKITIDLKVACKTGVNVNAVSSEVQSKVAEAITYNTDYDNVAVNVNVVSFFVK